MEVVVLFNGLGNQMFQYAFYLSKKHHCEECVIIKDGELFKKRQQFLLPEIFRTDYKRTFKTACLETLFRFCRRSNLRKVFARAGIPLIIEARNCKFSQEVLDKGGRGIHYYFGVWATEKYFIDIKSKIRETFTFPEPSVEAHKRILEEILNAGDRSVSIHIRRGDYVGNTDFGGVATGEYYTKALEIIRSQVPEAQIFIFSNDIGWCRENIVGENIIFSNNYGELPDWAEMSLMSRCKHHICANSTFSWWGAWLSPEDESGGITICPAEWWSNVETPDFYPDNWIKIDRKGTRC